MTTLLHKNCGGLISVDLAGKFELKTHSISVLPNGVSLGVLELSPKRGKLAPTFFVCEKCHKEISQEDVEEELVGDCLTCRTRNGVGSLYTSYYFPCVCESCKDSLQGKKGKVNEKLKELCSYFSVSPSDIRFVTFVELLKKPLD